MKLNTTVGIAIGLVVAVGLVAALLAVVKPSAKSAASAWKKAEGAKLLDEKRDVERTLARNNLLWEIAVFYIFSQIRSSQFLAASGMGFTTFLYLCALELLPAASLVAVIELF